MKIAATITLLLCFLGLAIPTAERAQAAAQAPREMSAPIDPDSSVPVPQPTEKALSYYRSGNILWLVNLLWGMAVPLVFLFSGLSAHIRDWAQKLGRKWFFVIGIYFAIFSAGMFLLDLPLSFYRDFVRQHAYGLSNQTLSKWLGDSLKSLLVEAVVGMLFLWVPYLLLRRSPKRWWLYTSLLSVPFMILFMLIAPVLIDPLFNKFGPMKDKALESKILALADRAGIGGGRVFEVNKSVDTKAVNAYVTGFGGTKRIVLWDTLLSKLNENEVLVVMGHEMGHYALDHVRNFIIFAFLLILLTLFLAYRLARGLIARYASAWGFDRLDDVASLPLLLLLTSIFFFAISPIVLGFSRYQEREADRFALEITRLNRPAATAFVKLQEENLGVPRPGLMFILWRASHPPTGERIDFCNEYRPWQTGGHTRYDHLFRR